MKIRFSSEALADLDHHLDYYAEHSARAKEEFWDQMQEALRLIAEFPALTPQVGGEVRRFILRRFSVGFVLRNRVRK